MADTYLISAVAIYKATHFTPNETIAINVARLQGYSPRNAWVKRYLVQGQNQIQYLLDFEPSSADVLDPNILQGLYIEVDGVGVVIDCINIADFIAVADGDQATLTRRYASGIPAFTTPTPTAYYVHRIDDASTSAHSQVTMDYVTQYFGACTFVSHVTGTSIYKLMSYTVPVPIGSDVITTS